MTDTRNIVERCAECEYRFEQPEPGWCPVCWSQDYFRYKDWGGGAENAMARTVGVYGGPKPWNIPREVAEILDEANRRKDAIVERTSAATDFHRGVPLNDDVNHPAHYNQGKIEVCDFIADQRLDYREGNIVKYICRYKHKGTALKDLRKAQWYLDHLIHNLEKEE